MRVLLSIKPEYANKIFLGTKRFEFRRAIFKNKDVKTVVVYASSPVRKVIGEFEIDRILSQPLDLLWEATKEGAGIDKDYFQSYFNDRDMGHAIAIKSTKAYSNPLCLRKDFNLAPPQSFLYLQEARESSPA